MVDYVLVIGNVQAGVEEPGRRRDVNGASRRRLLESNAHLRPLGCEQETPMKNPLDSLWGTIISGLVLTVILYYVVRSLAA